MIRGIDITKKRLTKIMYLATYRLYPSKYLNARRVKVSAKGN